MRSLRLLPVILAALLAGCTAGDATTSASTERLVGGRSPMAAQDRLDIPQFVALRLGGGRATLTWRPVAAAKGYQLVSCDTEPLPTVEKTSPTDTVQLYAGLTPGHSYGVKIRTRKVTGTSGGDANNSKFSECQRWVGAEPVATVLLSPPSVDLVVGGTVQFTATLLDRFGGVLTDREVSWTSSAPAAATVSTTGVATAVGAGSATITVASDGVTASATVTAREPVASLSLSPAIAQLYVGQTLQFVAIARDRFGNVLVGRVVQWSSAVPAVAVISANGLVTALARGSTTITATSEGISASASMTAQTPGWQLVAARGTIPASLTASAYAAASDAIFAGEMPDFGTGSLWRFDLATNRWTRLTANNWPAGKFRKLIYDDVRHRLLTYWDGLGQVFSIPETGGTWSLEGGTGNSDNYYEAFAFQNPVSGRLSVFGGYGHGAFRNTLWEWNGSNAWLAMPVSGQIPEPRFGSQGGVAVDAANARAFFTQRSLGGAPGNYDDLVALDLRGYGFRTVIGPSTASSARIGSAMAYDPASRTLYRFGGVTLYGTIPQADFVRCAPDAAIVAWSTMPASALSPSARYLPGLHFDVLRRRLVLVSGFDGANWTSDVWVRAVP